ncbi:MAG: hypothetical protein GY821_10680 [Gammaproteobacteria bacterium]|nr:hypothetical protein [Gammaproteobacteria bacterium]
MLTAKQERLTAAKKELEQEASNKAVKKKQITVVIEEELLFKIQEVALNRKKKGVAPHTVTGIVKEAFQEIVKHESSRVGPHGTDPLTPRYVRCRIPRF